MSPGDFVTHVPGTNPFFRNPCRGGPVYSNHHPIVFILNPGGVTCLGSLRALRSSAGVQVTPAYRFQEHQVWDPVSYTQVNPDGLFLVHPMLCLVGYCQKGFARGVWLRHSVPQQVPSS